MPLLIFFVLVVARAAHAPPDDEHPYGHERFESVGTIAMGIVFFTTAGILLYDSYHRLQEIEELPIPALGGIAIALLSILSKEWIYQYTIGVASRLNSSLLRANTWHSRGTDGICLDGYRARYFCCLDNCQDGLGAVQR